MLYFPKTLTLEGYMKSKRLIDEFLINSIMYGDLKSAQKRVEKGADVNCQSEMGNTPLMVAILNKRREICEWLLSLNVDVNLVDDEGNTALILAYQKGLKDVALKLIEQGADVNIKNLKGYTAKDYDLEESVSEAYVAPQAQSQEEMSEQEKESVEKFIDLVTKAKDHDSLKEFVDKEGENFKISSKFVKQALESIKQRGYPHLEERFLDVTVRDVLVYMAVLKNDGNAVRKALLGRWGVVRKDPFNSFLKAVSLEHIDAVSGFIIAERSPRHVPGILREAVKTGNKDMVHLLFAHEAKMQKGLDSELIDAAEMGYTHLFDILLFKGGKDNKDALLSAIWHSAVRGNKEGVQKLLREAGKFTKAGYSHTADISTAYMKEIATFALAGAVRGGHREVAQLLLEKGANIQEGAIMYEAALSGDVKLAKMLIDRGADLEKAQKFGPIKISPLTHAIIAKDYDMVQLFLDHGVRADKKVYANEVIFGARQRTAVHAYPILLAADHIDAKMIELLAQKGANINQMNKNKESVLDVYQKMGQAHLEAIKLDPKSVSLYDQTKEEFEKGIQLLREKGAKTAKELEAIRKRSPFFKLFSRQNG